MYKVTVKIRYWKFKNNYRNIQERDLSGCPTYVSATRLRGLVEENQYANIRELAREIDAWALSNSPTTHRINFTYKFSRWVPHKLTQADKDRRVRASTNLLEYQNKDKIMDRIVTFDEKWIYLNNTSLKEGLSAPLSLSSASQSKIWSTNNLCFLFGGIVVILSTKSI